MKVQRKKYTDGCCSNRELLQLFGFLFIAVAVNIAEAGTALFSDELVESELHLSLAESARLLGGDFSQLNAAIYDIVVNVSTESLQPDPVDVGFGVSAVIELGDGYCTNIQVRPEGDIQLHSGFGEPFIGPIEYERYFLELRAIALTFICYVEMEVSLFLGPVPLSGNNGGPGTLVFFPSEDATPPGAFLNTSIDVFSEDFSLSFPDFVNSTGCKADITDLDYSQSTNLGEAILVGDVTSIVVDRLKEDKTLVEEPVEEKLCELLSNVTDMIGDFIVNNPFTNISFKETDILGAENSLNVSADVELLDLSDNFVTDFLFPENGTSDLFDNLLGNRTISEMLGGFLDIDIGSGEGISNLDLMPLLGPLVNENYDSSVPLLNISNLLNISSLEIEVYVDNLFLTTTKLNIDLSTIEFPGEQTVTLPTIDLGDIDIVSNIRIVVSLGGISLGSISLPSLYLNESFQLRLDWNSFAIDASIFLAVNLNAFPFLQFGGITTSTVTCLLSTLVTPPMFTNLELGSTSIMLQVTGFEDAIAFIIGDAINSIFPILEGTLKLFLDSQLDSSIVNQELFDVVACPEAKIEDDLVRYDFSEGIFKTISDFITEDLAEKAVHVLTNILADDNGTDLVLIDETSNISFSVEVPVGLLQSQKIEFSLNQLGVFGLRPPTIHQVVLLFADPASPYFPQEIRNALKAASNSNPIGVDVKFSLDFSDGQFSEEEGRILQDPLVAKNDVSILLSLSTIQAALDIFAKLSKYDVNSITLEEITNLDCWVSRLEKPGGVLDLALLIDGLDIETACDCELVQLDAIVTSISSPQGIESISILLNELLEVVGYLVESPFSPENWDLTVENAKRSCSGLDALPSNTILLDPPIENLTVPQTLGGVLILALNVTFFVQCCCLRKKKKKPAKSLHIGSSSNQNETDDITVVSTSLFRSPLLSKKIRFGFPLAVLFNIVSFVIGDLDTAVIANVKAKIIGVEVELEEIAQLSVVSSTQKLLQEGAYGLAFMLVFLVLLWPYTKLFVLFVSWFLSPKLLSPQRRSVLLDLLDMLGKWSFVEFYFVSFILITFGTETGNPTFGFIPSEVEVLNVTLELIIQRGTYIFVFSVMLSMLLSNISIFLDARTHPSKRTTEEKEGFSCAHTAFINENASGYQDKYIRTTWFGRLVFSVIIVASIILILGLTNIVLVETEFIGLVGILKELGGDPELKSYYSIRELFKFAFTSNVQKGGYIFLGIASVTTALLMPVIQQAHLLYIFFAKSTAEGAYHSIRINKVLISWCCLEVLTLALVVSVLEVRFVSKSFVDDECATLVNPLAQLANAGFLDPEDADAVCYGVKGQTSPLAFLFVLAIVLYKCSTFLVLSLLEISANHHKGMVDVVEASTHHSFAYKILRLFYLVEFSPEVGFVRTESLTFSNIVHHINTRNAARVDRFEQETASENPMYTRESFDSVIV